MKGAPPEQIGFSTIDQALEALRRGRPVLVLDDTDRENEGDVVAAAQTLTVPWLAWAVRHSSGYLCAPMTAERAERLRLPLMVSDNQDPRSTAYTVSCDAATGITTGISAADRTRTIRLLGDPATGPDDLIRPGHVLPLRARQGGVLERRGHTEATVDLARLAGLEPVGVIGELVRDDGSMMRTSRPGAPSTNGWSTARTTAGTTARTTAGTRAGSIQRPRSVSSRSSRPAPPTLHRARESSDAARRRCRPCMGRSGSSASRTYATGPRSSP